MKQPVIAGKVTLVGFGPGNPDLLTIAGERAIANADIIFHDDLIDYAFLEKYKAEKIYVGKRCHRHSHEQDAINELMLDATRKYTSIVRLKGGDSMIFAHGGEEIEFLKSHNVEVAVIPGVSTGVAVAGLTQIPLTLRGIARSVAFITGHTTDMELPNTDTLVCFMAGNTIRKIATKAIAEGRAPDTPVAVVHNVSLSDQAEFITDLKSLCSTDTLFPTPVIFIIGSVVLSRMNSL